MVALSSFCHVAAKEGRCSVKVADVSDFWNGQPMIKVLDPNITACREKRDLMRQYRETGALIDFTQGIDIRLLNEADIEDLNAMRLADVHFAWDNANDDLADKFRMYAERGKKNRHGKFGTVYCLTNYTLLIIIVRWSKTFTGFTRFGIWVMTRT